MKFSQMKYERPDMDAVKAQITQLTKDLKSAGEAGDYAAAREAFLEVDKIYRNIRTMDALVSIRHSIDTRDEFYTNEEKFWQMSIPELQEYLQNWKLALLKSPLKDRFAQEFGNIIFINGEIELKTFSPEIIPDLQKENELVRQYEDLLASAKIPFNGGTYNISQMGTFKESADDSERLSAWKAEGQWYKDNQEKLDDLYDQLVHLRDSMGKKLGYEGYTELGYYRMGRNCYTKEDIDVFRNAVVKYLVPVASDIFKEQAKRLGKEYPMSFADNALSFRSGNPKPCKDLQGILDHGQKLYDELSPETSEFFRMMLDNELLDVAAKEGKQVGGYCADIPDYGCPFIFANFNGTSDDVETVTHEAGHAFEGWLNRKRIPVETQWPTMEACEVHSMSMEFFAWPWAEGFYGADTKKFYYSHLSAAIKFIPYGTMVDHFQHIVFEKPDMTPKERHGVWKELLGIYMPWMKLDGDIPFYSEGEGWQRQHHIYSMPFYYIDYCLAQTVALQFWAKIQDNPKDAWKHYMAYTSLGGSDTFTGMLKAAGLESPFDEATLKGVCQKASDWLGSYDLSGIK